MDFTEALGLFASALVILSWVPQVQKSLKTRHLKDFSWGMLALMFASTMMFLVYGLLISKVPVWFPNLVISIFVATLIFLKWRHG